MSYLRKVSRLSGVDNPGAVLSMFVARKADVLNIPAPFSKTIVGDITFGPGAGFVEWIPTHGKASFRTSGKASREGSSRSNTLDFEFPLDQEILRGMLEQAEEDEFIVVFTLANGKTKLFGTLDCPVRFQFNQDVGQEVQDGTINKCRFYYDGPDNTYFYSGAIAEQPASDVGAIVEYADGTPIALLSPTDILIVSSDFEHSFTHVPGIGYGLACTVRWDTGEIIKLLYPGDKLVVDTDFDFDFEIIDNA